MIRLRRGNRRNTRNSRLDWPQLGFGIEFRINFKRLSGILQESQLTNRDFRLTRTNDRTASAKARTCDSARPCRFRFARITSASPQNSHRIWRHDPHGGVSASVSATTATASNPRSPSEIALKIGDPLGAQRQAVRGIFHVAAGKNSSGFRAHRGAHAEIGIGRVRVLARGSRRGDQCVVTGVVLRILFDHGRSLLMRGITARNSATKSAFTRSPVSMTSSVVIG